MLIFFSFFLYSKSSSFSVIFLSLSLGCSSNYSCFGEEVKLGGKIF
jgi:hypothetical protein